jgi:hypothetical protein
VLTFNDRIEQIIGPPGELDDLSPEEVDKRWYRLTGSYIGERGWIGSIMNRALEAFFKSATVPPSLLGARKNYAELDDRMIESAAKGVLRNPLVGVWALTPAESGAVWAFEVAVKKMLTQASDRVSSTNYLDPIVAMLGQLDPVWQRAPGKDGTYAQWEKFERLWRRQDPATRKGVYPRSRIAPHSTEWMELVDIPKLATSVEGLATALAAARAAEPWLQPLPGYADAFWQNPLSAIYP